MNRLHRSRERNRKLATKKARAMRNPGRLTCEGCGFDFAETYGERGEVFMEMHRTRPMHEIRPDHVTRLANLAVFCANCHRMIHARRPWPTIEELTALVSRGE